MIRAKFRCMSTTQTWDNIHSAEFRPVHNKKTGQNYDENKMFWEATPAGEARMTFVGPHEFVPGAYYYILMVPNPEGGWRLSEVRCSDGYNAGDLKLSSDWNYPVTGFRNGEVQMSIRFAHTLKLFGEVGGKWDVTFSFAEPSDG